MTDLYFCRPFSFKRKRRILIVEEKRFSLIKNTEDSQGILDIDTYHTNYIRVFLSSTYKYLSYFYSRERRVF